MKGQINLLPQHLMSNVQCNTHNNRHTRRRRIPENICRRQTEEELVMLCNYVVSFPVQYSDQHSQV